VYRSLENQACTKRPRRGTDWTFLEGSAAENTTAAYKKSPCYEVAEIANMCFEVEFFLMKISIYTEIEVL
jgi:hypothetical protein